MGTHLPRIAPSLLSADFSSLKDDILLCEHAGAEILHIDVMDGHFVPNITLGPLVVDALRRHTSMIFDCHLMVEDPDAYIPLFAKAGANWISVHIEAVRHLQRTLTLIRQHSCRAGIVLNPLTPLEYAYSAAADVDYILLMSVNPGFGGQVFIPSFLERCATLRLWLDTHGFSHIEIQVDGGVSMGNVAEIVRAGASLIVSGNSIFSGNITANFTEMRSLAQHAQSSMV